MENVEEYIKQVEKVLPSGWDVDDWDDETIVLAGRKYTVIIDIESKELAFNITQLIDGIINATDVDEIIRTCKNVDIKELEDIQRIADALNLTIYFDREM